MASKTVRMESKEEKNPLPKLSLKQKAILAAGSASPSFFRNHTRPMLYRISENDPELVHDIVINMAHRYGPATHLVQTFLPPPNNLTVNINGKEVLPFGTAAGMDKNFDAVKAFGNLFGFQEGGTIVVPQRPGNNRIRMATFEEQLDLFNAQGFPSKGVLYAQRNLEDYRVNGGEGKIYASICGLPAEGARDVQAAFDDMRTLMIKLGSYVDGFVWNPYSPNTDSLKLLRTPEVFRQTAKLMKEYANGKILLVKLGPYEEEDTHQTMKLLGAFIFGGGDGAVTTNTKMFLKQDLPESIRETWGYASAGRSGTFLKNYRLRSVKDIRERFQNATIIATGGIFTGEDAYDTFKAGANAIEGYTPYTYQGPGLVRVLMHGVAMRLEFEGYKNLAELQQEVKNDVKHGIFLR